MTRFPGAATAAMTCGPNTPTPATPTRPARQRHPSLCSGRTASSAAHLTLFARHQHPQCLIGIEGAGTTRAVYAARLPDGLDLMARWAANAGALTALANGMHPDLDLRGRPTAEGLVEMVTRRAQKVLQ